MTLKEFFRRTDLLGGDVEVHEAGNIFRGRIARICLIEGVLRVMTEWAARFNPEMPGYWEVYSRDPQHVFLERLAGMSGIKVVDRYRLGLVCPGLPPALFISSYYEDCLDPARVSGLITDVADG